MLVLVLSFFRSAGGAWRPEVTTTLQQGEFGESDELATFLGGLVGEDAGAGDVGRLRGVRVAVPVAAQQFDELVGEVRVRAAVATALGEG